MCARQFLQFPFLRLITTLFTTTCSLVVSLLFLMYTHSLRRMLAVNFSKKIFSSILRFWLKDVPLSLFFELAMNSASMVKGRGEKRLFSPSHPIHIFLATVVRHLFSCISLNLSATRCKILPLWCPYTHFLQVCHTWSNCLCTIHLNV